MEKIETVFKQRHDEALSSHSISIDVLVMLDFLAFDCNCGYGTFRKKEKKKVAVYIPSKDPETG